MPFFADMALVSTFGRSDGVGSKYSVVDGTSSSDGEVAGVYMGGAITTFSAIVTDNTLADVKTTDTKNADNLSLPLPIPHSGGSFRLKIVAPVDQLMNPQGLDVRLGWKLRKTDATGAVVNIAVADAIVPTGDLYPISKVDVVINNKQQYGASADRDYGPDKRRVGILMNMGTTIDDLERAYERYNGFHPNSQSRDDNVAGHYKAYVPDTYATVATGIQDHSADRLNSLNDYTLWLQERNIRKIAESREVFSTVELFREGVFGLTKVFPGVVTDCDLIIHFRPIMEMFAEEARAAGSTHALNGAFFQLTTVTVSQQSVVPSTQLWKTLQDSASASGGKANLPSYPTKVVEVYNGPRSFPTGSRSLLVAITGNDVPDKLTVVVRAARNSSTLNGSSAYLELPNMHTLSLAVATQGRLAFQSPGTSPFSDATVGMISLETLHAHATEAEKLRGVRYREYFADAILKNLCISNGDNTHAFNKFLYRIENWIHGNSIFTFNTTTVLSNDGEMKSPVYTAPFTVKAMLNDGTTESTSVFLIGSSNGILSITQTNEILATRFSGGTDVSTALAASAEDTIRS